MSDARPRAGYHPWFEPLWRRLLTVGLCVAWLAVEGLGSRAFDLWFWIALAALLWAVWDLFLSGKYRQRPA